ncbi:MAG TPA: LacI family DNA-binding transcriptional regulator [Chitinophagaceae bacterium]|jgi:LacI family transcriptional regulator|nr:LacI family DNA-binding transcriptional regulator [Chitinophagaceae bacterium]
MESVDLKKLAKLLNLSISTVSKALRDSYDISKETKERVIALANELNYQPNPHASSLRRHKSKTIAVIIPEIANNFFTLAINGIESIAQEKGYHVLIYITHEDVEKEVAFIKHLHNGRVDGVLISLSSTTQDYSHIKELQERGLPIVFFDRVYEHLNTACIITDDYESSYKATQHLIDKGCTKIAHLMISESTSIGNKRMKGYVDAIHDNGLPFDEKMLVHCTNDDEQDYKLVEQLFKSKRPDGVFAAVERYAILCYDVCNRLKLSIPEDIKLISFSNLQAAAFLNPPLSTITQPAFDIGKEAASILFKALDKKTFKLKQENIVFKSTLVERDSTSNGTIKKAAKNKKVFK